MRDVRRALAKGLEAVVEGLDFRISTVAHIALEIGANVSSGLRSIGEAISNKNLSPLTAAIEAAAVRHAREMTWSPPITVSARHNANSLVAGEIPLFGPGTSVHWPEIRVDHHDQLEVLVHNRGHRDVVVAAELLGGKHGLYSLPTGSAGTVTLAAGARGTLEFHLLQDLLDVKGVRIAVWPVLR